MIDTQIGTLVVKPAIEHTELMAPKVAQMLLNNFANAKINIAEIDPNLSDTAAFCANYQIPIEHAANCVVLEAKRAERKRFAACVVLGSTRVDVNGLAKRTLDARRVSFARMEEAVAQTEMEYGAITPIGLPAEWSILIDKAVIDSSYVIIGSGIRKSKIIAPGNVLSSILNVQILESLGNKIQPNGVYLGNNLD